MAIDFLSGEFTGEQVVVSSVMRAPLVKNLEAGESGFVDYTAVWMDKRAKVWIDTHAPCVDDEELVGDDCAVVINTPIGFVVDVSYMNEDGNSDEFADEQPTQFRLLPQVRPNYEEPGLDVLPAPVVGLVTSSLERDIFSRILFDQFEIEYPETIDQQAQ